MRGISLPVRTLVIITVAVIVLLGASGIFLGGFGMQGEGITYEMYLDAGCLKWRNSGCSDVGAHNLISLQTEDGGTLSFTEVCLDVFSYTGGCYEYCCDESPGFWMGPAGQNCIEEGNQFCCRDLQSANYGECRPDLPACQSIC